MQFDPVTITLPLQDWTYVVQKLRMQPMHEVEALVAEMRRQVSEQTQPKEEPKGKEDGGSVSDA